MVAHFRRRLPFTAVRQRQGRRPSKPPHRLPRPRLGMTIAEARACANPSSSKSQRPSLSVSRRIDHGAVFPRKRHIPELGARRREVAGKLFTNGWSA